MEKINPPTNRAKTKPFANRKKKVIGGRVKCLPRTAKEMEPVLAEKYVGPDRVVYNVYRGKEPKKDRRKARENNLRYDITYLYPKYLGRELSKTYGHYHNTDYPEIMEVVSGHGWFLLQRYGKNPKNITEAYLVEAKSNEKVIAPPKFGHIMINPSQKKTFIMANWLSTNEKSDYKPVQKLHGGCYYFIRGKKGIIPRKNKNYAKVPELIKLRPKEVPELGAVRSKPLYSLIKTPAKLAFINNPKKFKNLLTIENCYRKI